MTSNHLSLRQAAARLGLHWKTVYDLVRKGRIPAYRPGVSDVGAYRLTLEDVEAYRRSRKVKVTPVAPPPVARRGRRKPVARELECVALGLNPDTHEFR